MDFPVFLTAWALIFVAELGDKTQLAVMTLAHRHRARHVFAGAALAFAVLNLLAVLAGEALYRYVPEQVMLAGAGVLFLAFAWKAWHDGAAQAAEMRPLGSGSVFLATFALIFVAELGDKTQLAMVALAAGTGAPWSVFAGGTLALWAVSAVAIAVGRTVLRRIPARLAHRGAAVLFAACGVAALSRPTLSALRVIPC